MLKLIFIIINLIYADEHFNGVDTFLNYKISDGVLNKKSDIILAESINPSIYIVGPGDQFFLNVLSNNLSINEYIIVSPVGDVILPNLSLVNINKLTLSDAFLLIEEKYTEKFDNIEFGITLTDVRKFNVEIKGFGNTSFYITVNPIQKISDIYRILSKKYSNDVFNQFSNRRIGLIRNKVEYTIDILETDHDTEAFNPFIVENDIIIFSKIKETIHVNGAVTNSGIYEYKEKESLYDFIEKIGGLSFNADISNIYISNYREPNKNMLKVNWSNAENMFLNPYDHININYLLGYSKSPLVKIIGEINTPGNYILEDGMTINDLINRAGGYTEFADSLKITINNINLNQLSDHEFERIKLIPPQNRTISEISYFKSKHLISSKMPFSNAIYENRVLNADDVVEIPKNINYIEIIGGINSPGFYPFNPLYTIEEYIIFAGGISKFGTNKIYIIDSFNVKKRIRDDSITLKNGDILFIETKQDINLWNKLKESMGVIGQIATLIAVIQSAQNN